MTEEILHHSSQQHRIVALLSDFGGKDHYVAAMKGAILSRNPHVTLVDISHAVEPMNVAEAGFLLWAAYRSFPEGTLFLAVVDPGVGTSRPVLILETPQYLFLAPDNGLLDFICSQERTLKAFTLEMEKAKPLLPAERSHTFHGRDIFAPVIGALSKGYPLADIATERTPPHPARKFLSLTEQAQTPAILHIDTFGNIITNILLSSSGEGKENISAVSLAGKRITTWVDTYANAAEGIPSLLVGSTGLVEIAIRNDSAASILGVTTKSHMNVEWKK